MVGNRQHKILDCSNLEFIMDNTLGLVDLGLNDLNILNFFFKSEKKVSLNLDISPSRKSSTIQKQYSAASN